MQITPARRAESLLRDLRAVGSDRMARLFRKSETAWCRRLETRLHDIAGRHDGASRAVPAEDARSDVDAAAAAAVVLSSLLARNPAPQGRGPSFLDYAARLFAACHVAIADLTYPPTLLDAHRWYDSFYEIRVFDQEVTRRLAVPLDQSLHEIEAMVCEFRAKVRRPCVPMPSDHDPETRAPFVDSLLTALSQRYQTDLRYAPQGRPGHAALSRVGGAAASQVASRAIGLARRNAWVLGLLLAIDMDRARDAFLRRHYDKDNMGASSFAFGRDEAVTMLCDLHRSVGARRSGD